MINLMLAAQIVPPGGNPIIDGHIAMGYGMMMSMLLILAPLCALLSVTFTLMGFVITCTQFRYWSEL